jgi:hypothetical protein
MKHTDVYTERHDFENLDAFPLFPEKNDVGIMYLHFMYCRQNYTYFKY